MKGDNTMKKLMSIIVSILFALSLTGLCFAQDKPAAPAAPEEKAEKKVEKKKVKKHKKHKKAKKEKKTEEAAPAPEKK